MKQKLREAILEKRNSLTKEEIKKKSNIIRGKLFSLPKFKKAETVLFYVSKDNEVYTHDMIRDLLGKKKIIVPVTDLKNKDLILSELNDFSDLEPGYYGVLEPKKIKKVSPSGIDIVIVPGIAFDRKGNRIGYGVGYYDIFLKKTKALKIGLAYDFQIVDEIKTEDFDVSVDVVVTDKEIIRV